MRRWISMFVRIGLAAVVALAVVAGVAWYQIFGQNAPLVDGATVGPATTIVDGFVAIYAIPSDTGVVLVDAGIDPGGAALDAGLARMGRTRADVRAIFLTHGHGDHIAAAAHLAAPVYAMAAEAPIVSGAERPTSTVGGLSANDGSVTVTHPLEDGATVTVDGVEVTVLHLPGHTVGSAAIVVGDVVFLGDSANSHADGSLHGAVGIFSDDTALVDAGLKALPGRLPPSVTRLAFGHSAPLGVDALRAYHPLMPITDCPTHGTHACTEVCEHLAEAHAKGGYVVPVVLPVLPIDLCALCVREHRVDALPSGDEGLARIQAVYDAVNVRSRLICDACRDATRVAHARSTGAELPCEPFEHTLTDADDPRLDALAELIRSHLSPRGNHAGRFHGCQVFPGTALRPVLVRMFGVGDDDARSAMTERIDRYFDGIDAFQRKLEYYEAMAWEDQEVDGAVTRVRKPLVLIDEVLRRVAPQP